MSHLTNLLHAAADHLFPPTWPALESRKFFDDMPAIWTRHDAATRCTWGFAGIRLCVNDDDSAAHLEDFLTRLGELLPFASAHLGLASWPLAEPVLQGWANTQTASDSQAIFDVRQSRKA
jgi:hypothetical protein